MYRNIYSVGKCYVVQYALEYKYKKHSNTICTQSVQLAVKVIVATMVSVVFQYIADVINRNAVQSHAIAIG